MGVAEVARWLGVSESWVRDHASRRRRPFLPAMRLDGLLKFRAGEIETWLEEQKIAA